MTQSSFISNTIPVILKECIDFIVRHSSTLHHLLLWWSRFQLTVTCLEVSWRCLSGAPNQSPRIKTQNSRVLWHKKRIPSVSHEGLTFPSEVLELSHMRPLHLHGSVFPALAPLKSPLTPHPVPLEGGRGLGREGAWRPPNNNPVAPQTKPHPQPRVVSRDLEGVAERVLESGQVKLSNLIFPPRESAARLPARQPASLLASLLVARPDSASATRLYFAHL
ncbi:hypothetical protein E2C01_029119 [Portunus trituberculatus]|uniref:Uncharacterized protein n=1 Tax=Portunus trituberculatus TaxID=210409 RepID=A0A5B7EM88_PORTR|nr:hypothetical protein [Portunus trituberculatus]